MKHIYNFILDSEHNDECIIFTMCVFLFCNRPSRFGPKPAKLILQSSTLIVVSVVNLINWIKLVLSRLSDNKLDQIDT